MSSGMSPCVCVCVCQSQNHSGWVTHPCYPADHSATVRLSGLFDSPCTEQYRPERYEPQASVTVRGSGRYQQCLGNMSAIFSFHSCRFSRCSFDNAFQPNVSGSFMVTGPSPKSPDVAHWTFNSRLPGHCTVLKVCEVQTLPESKRLGTFLCATLTSQQEAVAPPLAVSPLLVSVWCQAFSAFFFIHSFLERVSGVTVNTPALLEQATRTLCTMTYSQVATASLSHAAAFLYTCKWSEIHRTQRFNSQPLSSKTHQLLLSSFPH